MKFINANKLHRKSGGVGYHCSFPLTLDRPASIRSAQTIAVKNSNGYVSVTLPEPEKYELVGKSSRPLHDRATIG